MRFAAGILTALLSGLSPPGAEARCSSDDCRELKGLTAVRVVIEDLGPKEQSLGLQRADLTKTATNALRTELPRLRLSSSADTHLQIQTTVMMGKYESGGRVDYAVVFVGVRLREPADPEMGAPEGRTAWEEASVLEGPFSGLGVRVHLALNRQIATFAADWRRANPGG